MMLHRHFDTDAEPHPPPPRIRDRAFSLPQTDEKAVVYAGTRNLYGDMIPALKSLLANADIDRVFFLIETNKYPGDLPTCVETVNVESQPWFDPNGPNYHSHWTYMAIIRAALTKMFPEYHKILSLDVDTIVEDDVAPLWDIEFDDYYFALATELKTLHHGKTYYNVGVMFQNLDKLRSDGTDDRIIESINKEKHMFPEQDPINRICTGHLYPLDARYNDSFCCGYAESPAVIHYAGFGNWQNNTAHKRFRHLVKYRNMSWAEVAAKRREKFGKTLEWGTER